MANINLSQSAFNLNHWKSNFGISDLNTFNEGWEEVSDPSFKWSDLGTVDYDTAKELGNFNEKEIYYDSENPTNFRRLNIGGQDWMFYNQNGKLFRKKIVPNGNSGVTLEGYSATSPEVPTTPETTPTTPQGPYSPKINISETGYADDYDGVGIGNSVRRKWGLFYLNRDPVYDALAAGNILRGANVSANRLLKANVPNLKDPVEHLHWLYGDYDAYNAGYATAGALLHKASKAITSDANQVAALQLEAVSNGQKAITQGTTIDNAMRNKTSEVAWNLNKQNRENRHSVAMENRKALLDTLANAAKIKNLLTTAKTNTFDTLIKGYLKDWQELKVEREALLDKYDRETATLQGIDEYLAQVGNPLLTYWVLFYLNNPSKYAELYKNKIISDDIASGVAQAVLQGSKQGSINYYRKRGVIINEPINLPEMQEFNFSGPTFDKQGGTLKYASGGSTAASEASVYKAKLTKRTKDAERLIKSIADKNNLVVKIMGMQVADMEKATMHKPIKHLYGGQIAYVPLNLVRTPSEKGEPTGPAIPAIGGSSTKKAGLGDKEFLTMLKEIDGLPSDILAIEESLSGVFGSSSIADPLGLNTGNLEALYILALSKIKQAKFHKEAYKETVNDLSKKEALTEAAIDSQGQILMSDGTKDGFAWIHPSQIQEALSLGFHYVTNNEILEKRAMDINNSFDQHLIQVALGGVGMKQIETQISEIFKSVGQEDLETEELVKISGHDPSKVKGGINLLQRYLLPRISRGEDLQTALTGLYKSKIIDNDNIDQLNDAMSFLLQSLPENSKSLLLTKVGGDPDKLNELLLTRINASRKSKASFTFDYTKLDDSDNSKSKSDSNDATKMGPAELLQYGFGQVLPITIATGDSGLNAFRVDAISLPITKGGKPVGISTVEDLIGSDYAGYLDTSNVSFGGAHVSPEVMNQILAGSQIFAGYLPAKSDDQGHIIPDIELLNVLLSCEDELSVEGITRKSENYAEALNAKLAEKGMPDMFIGGDINRVNKEKYIKFAMVDSSASENAFGENVKLNDTIGTISDPKVAANVIGRINKELEKDSAIDYEEPGFWGKGTQVYRGVLFIPIQDNPFSIKVGEGYGAMSSDQANLLLGDYEAHARLSKIKAGKLTL